MNAPGKVLQLQGRQQRAATADGANSSFSNSFIRLVEHSLREGQLSRRDLLRAVCDTYYHPEWVRLDLQVWLAEAGITAAMGGEAKPLSPCPFSSEELRAADESNEIPIAVPGGLRREHLAKAFDLPHWAISEKSVQSEAASGTVWLLVSASDELSSIGKSPTEAVAAADKSSRTGLSLEEYVLFAQRLRYLTGRLPDARDWTWLPRSTYATSLVLCAGFPAYNDLFVNVWPWAEFQGNIGLRLAQRAGGR